MSYTVLKNLKHDGVPYSIGDAFSSDSPSHVLSFLVEAGLISPASESEGDEQKEDESTTRRRGRR